jgi:hypothetical protein
MVSSSTAAAAATGLYLLRGCWSVHLLFLFYLRGD